MAISQTSYNALAPLVAFSQWNGSPKSNFEPLTRPGRFGARASKLMTLLLEGHEGVELSEEDIERLATWMDANALFYGTFNVERPKAPAERRAYRRAGVTIASIASDQCIIQSYKSVDRPTSFTLAQRNRESRMNSSTRLLARKDGARNRRRSRFGTRIRRTPRGARLCDWSPRHAGTRTGRILRRHDPD